MSKSETPPVGEAVTSSAVDDQSDFFRKLKEAESLQKAALEIGLDQTQTVLKKYEKSRRIVEEGGTNVRIKLDVHGDFVPLVEIQANGELLGYINDHERNNTATFSIGCLKRGNGRWDKVEIVATPIRAWAKYFCEGKKVARFAASEGLEVPIYITIGRRRNLFGMLRELPPALAEWSQKQ